MGLKQSLFNTAFLTFAHNQYAIAFFCGALIALGLLIYKPSRFATFLLVGFLTLLIGFEYDKHILEGLQNQTLDSLSLENDDAGFRSILVGTFQKLLPLGFFAIGWGSVFLAIISRGLKGEKSNANSKQSL